MKKIKPKLSFQHLQYLLRFGSICFGYNTIHFHPLLDRVWILILPGCHNFGTDIIVGSMGVGCWVCVCGIYTTHPTSEKNLDIKWGIFVFLLRYERYNPEGPVGAEPNYDLTKRHTWAAGQLKRILERNQSQNCGYCKVRLTPGAAANALEGSHRQQNLRKSQDKNDIVYICRQVAKRKINSTFIMIVNGFCTFFDTHWGQKCMLYVKERKLNFD